MGKMNIVLGDELEERFRKAVFESKGMKKGNISEALEEAVEKWITEKNKKHKRVKIEIDEL
jgi:hypothetical protein